MKKNIRISGLMISEKNNNLQLHVINKSRDWRVTAIDITYVFNEDGYDEKMEYRLGIALWNTGIYGPIRYQEEARFVTGQIRTGILENYKKWWIDNVYGEKVKK